MFRETLVCLLAATVIVGCQTSRPTDANTAAPAGENPNKAAFVRKPAADGPVPLVLATNQANSPTVTIAIITQPSNTDGSVYSPLQVQPVVYVTDSRTGKPVPDGTIVYAYSRSQVPDPEQAALLKGTGVLSNNVAFTSAGYARFRGMKYSVPHEEFNMVFGTDDTIDSNAVERASSRSGRVPGAPRTPPRAAIQRLLPLPLTPEMREQLKREGFTPPSNEELTNRRPEPVSRPGTRAEREGDYIYKTRDGKAAISGFNRDYAGPLSVTETLGNCPVTAIEAWGFMNCTGLTHVTIHAGITRIWPQAFTRCPGLIGFSVDEQNPAYRSTDGVLFDKGQSTLVKFPGGRVGNYAIPDAVANIGYWGFKGCGSLASVAIPASVTNIGSEAFDEMPSLTAITVAEGSARYSSVDGVLFSKDHTALVQFPGGRTGHYKVPDGVTGIQAAAFAFCRKLESITVPASVTEIARMAFYDCPAKLMFLGRPPKISVFAGDHIGSETVYYWAGATGWGSTFGGRPTAAWEPNEEAQRTGSRDGVPAAHDP